MIHAYPWRNFYFSNSKNPLSLEGEEEAKFRMEEDKKKFNDKNLILLPFTRLNFLISDFCTLELLSKYLSQKKCLVKNKMSRYVRKHNFKNQIHRR